MDAIIDIIIIQIIVCFIVDTSGFIGSIKRLIMSKAFNIDNPDDSMMHIPPFDCSLCMTFWAANIWLLCTGQWTLAMLAFTCIASLLASNMSELQLLVKDLISKVESWIEKQTH